MSVLERAILIKRLRICFNCLRQGHLIKECTSSRTCKMCNKKHHTLIHNQQHQTIKRDASTSQTESTSSNFLQGQNTTSAHLSNKTLSRNMSVVYLSTAVVRTYDINGKEIHSRALLDSGSESSFITKEASQLLGLKTNSIHLNINGISGSMCTSKEVIEMTIYSRINNFTASFNCFVLPKLTAYTPSMNIYISKFKIPQHLQLADPNFQISAQIDMLIGTEIFYNIISSSQISAAKNLPILQNSQFGWIVAGRYTKCNLLAENITSCNLSINLDEQIKRFWEIEEVCHERKFSPEEVKCEEHFRQNTTRQEDGRYVVKLPFKENYEDLGDSKTMCLKRFHSLEQRLNRNNDQKIEYSEFLREYIALGHMVKISANEETGYFLQHHSIIKKGSLSTKLRVVFDGSANSSSGLSLNDVLMVGPTIQDDLFSIVTRFRLHKYVFTADIEKMYRQILVNDNDSNYQKIVWRENHDQPIETYKLRTVTYGTGPAPFLAVRCIHQLVVDEGAPFKLAPAKIKKDFYVDNILTGADTLEEAALLRDELISLLSLGGFNLRKWSSNQMNLLKNLRCSDPLVALDPTKTIKTLGLHWNAHEDEILYSVNDTANSNPITKRQILSEIAKLFDPLGLLGPIIVTAKILMQKLWQLKLHWDEPVPPNVSTMWNDYCKDLPVLCSLRILRRIVIEAASELQLHGFCDASEVAYGACIYIRSTDNANNSLMRLVCSKSRVALKKIILPRLELCAAVLLSNLLNVIVKSLDVQFSRIYCWSGSTITLHWINAEPHLLKTFVANRVSEVQSLTNASQWKHISSEENPADVISRGELPTSIYANSLWWNGPSWILADEATWPNRKIIIPKDVSNLYELKDITIQSNVTFNQCTVFGKFSSLRKLQRVMAYCHRFGRNLKCQINEGNLGPLTVDELNQSLKFLIKAAQGELYSDEINDLSQKNIINKNSSLIKLQPFLDKDNILRVGGRLQNSELSFENKHQIILPQKHILTKQIIESEHKHMLHAGLQAVLYEIRKLYWPINARNLTRSILNKCLICYRFKAKECNQIMGNLPKCRVQLSRPFVNTGVDYGGPLLIRQSSNRKSALVKSYIALFICMATKAIHLELVTGLSTEHFLAALRRFIARRGKCAHIFSDNGTNFRGAHHELQDLHAFFDKQSNSDNIINAAAAEQIQWHFIPPRSPHFGGLWEAGIKSVKYHLKRVIGESHLTFEELYTTLVQIESCVNSRPVTPLYDNPNDFSILTPGHFLIGDSLTQPAEPDLVQFPINKLSRWQLTKQLQQHFWKRWSSDYLNSLQQRGKWTTETENLKIGCLVLVKDNNIPPLQWKLARITALHPGTDKKVRVASIITSSGSYKRSITKLCVLPLDQ